jgi:signal transduction histidine kinase
LSATGAGYGLTGLRERAELLGGTLHAGPDGSGWTIELRLPEQP